MRTQSTTNLSFLWTCGSALQPGSFASKSNRIEETPLQDEQTSDKQYTKPEISDHGDLTDLTAGLHVGTSLDATFPVHTPKTQLRFSTP